MKKKRSDSDIFIKGNSDFELDIDCDFNEI